MNNIFEDLEIDFSDNITDPNAFAARVHKKADELVSVLESTNSVSAYLAQLPEVDYDFKSVDSLMNNMWEVVDRNVPTQALEEVAKRLRKLASSIEFIAKDRALAAIAATNGTVDKAVVHDQYIELRAKFNKFIDALSIIRPGKYKLEKLPAKSGNYGSVAGLSYWVFIKGDQEDEPFRNHKVVALSLGLERDSDLMTVVEYIQANPNCGWTASKYEV